jgi:protocatechuate 3,4-dioxygenase alpha subunit
MSLLTTSSQTVGPYVKIGFEPFTVVDLAPPGVTGERIALSGRVTDGDGKPVNDAVI